jgi:hypothetical protein
MYLNVNNPVNYQLQGFGQNGVRTISTDQLYIQGEYYRVLVAEEDSYVTAVSVLGDDLTAEFVYAGTTIYGLFTEVSVSSGSLTAYIAGPTDIEDVWAYINAYGEANAARIEAADCAKDAIAPLLDKYYAKASLVMVPSLYKTSIVYSERPLTTAGQLAFTRSNDTATRVGPDGYIEKVRTNLLLQSETFSNASWGKTISTITDNATTAPNGTTTADKLIAEIGGGGLVQHRIDQTTVSASGSNTFSVYAKKGEIEFIFFRIGLSGAWFNLNNGSVSNVSAGIVASSVDAGSGWYRLIITKASAFANEIVRINLSTGAGLSDFIGNNTDGAFIWGAQYETGDIATDYIPTTTTAVSVGPVANLPRLNYPINSDGSVGCPSLLLEPQRTNVVPYSEQLSQWTLVDATLTSNDAISPDGYQNADKIVTLSAGCDVKYTNVSVSASTTYTASFWVKLTSGTGLQGRFYDNINGANIEYYIYDSQITIGEWSRVTRTFTTPSGCTNIQVWYLASSSSVSVTAHFWGFQCEAGSYETSYIPTLGAAVTRGADSCSKTGISSLIGQTEGTLYLEADIQKRNDADFYVALSAGSVLGDAIYLYQPSSGILQLLIRKTGNADGIISILSANWTAGLNKLAIAYTSTTAEVFINGASKGLTSFVSLPTLSQLTLAARPDNPGVLVGVGPYNQALLFKTRLTNQELQDLTTL